MNKLLEVREFDKISCNPDYKNEYAYLPASVFNELEDFIHSSTAELDNADALDFLRVGYRRNLGDYVAVNNYVGLIQMKNGYQIQILPKIDFGAGLDDDQETKRVFLKMLRSMKDFPSKVFNDANLKVTQMNLYEIFINMYIQEVRVLVKHGLKSAYLHQEENLNTFKGKLLVKEQIKHNFSHGERFYVQFEEYSLNRAENRLVKATLLKLQSISGSAQNQKELRQLLLAFEQVKESMNYEKDFAEVSLDRSTKDYENLMQWSKVFLFNKSFSTFSGSTTTRALLFPMERVFESYVAQQLRKSLIDFEWDISTQDRGYYLFDSPRQFALRPDIVITRDDGKKIILDTKWKSLTNRPRVNYGISQADMYQMYAYAKKYGTSQVWVLYPLNDDMRNSADISFISEDGVSVHVFFVDIPNIETSLAKLKTELVQT